jgi:FkbM family methyltransferase
MGRRVLAIDASQRHIDLIDISRRVNELSLLSPVRRAITREDGEVGFCENGLFSAVDFTGGSDAAVMVPSERLSSLLGRYGFNYLHLIKMDIEGSELIALESISQVLECEDGPAIIYESNEETFRSAGYSVPEFRRWLEARGYRTFRVEGSRWVYAPPEQPQPELWVDVLALKPFHQRRFADAIDEFWDHDVMRDRFRIWGSLPHDSTRNHVISLLEDGSLRTQHPDLEMLAVELILRKAESVGP